MPRCLILCMEEEDSGPGHPCLIGYPLIPLSAPLDIEIEGTVSGGLGLVKITTNQIELGLE